MGDFLDHMDGGMGFYQEFPPFSFTMYSNFTVEKCKRLHEFEEIRKMLREFEEIEVSRQSCRGYCDSNSKEELRRFFSGFRPRPQYNVLPTLWMTYVNATTII